MKNAKRARLERDGWRVGNEAEFLGLTPEEAELVELRIALADRLRTLRTERGLTQTQFARLFGSSQSRVAKMEAADATVSLDLLVRSLLALGMSRREVGTVIRGAA